MRRDAAVGRRLPPGPAFHAARLGSLRLRPFEPAQCQATPPLPSTHGPCPPTSGGQRSDACPGLAFRPPTKEKPAFPHSHPAVPRTPPATAHSTQPLSPGSKARWAPLTAHPLQYPSPSSPSLLLLTPRKPPPARREEGRPGISECRGTGPAWGAALRPCVSPFLPSAPEGTMTETGVSCPQVGGTWLRSTCHIRSFELLVSGFPFSP